MRRDRSDTASQASGIQLLIRLESVGLPLLHRTRADGHTEAFVLEPADARLTVGRSPECDVVIDDDPGVSRVHLELVRLGDGWLAEDQGLSRNGTLLDSEPRNGTLLDSEPLDGRRRLHDAARLTVGQTVLEFRAASADGGSTPTVTVGVADAPPAITAAQRAVLVELVRPMLTGAASPAGNAEIAATLVVSPETVKSHLKDLYVRFDLEAVPPAQKRAELAQQAVTRGAVGRGDLR